MSIHYTLPDRYNCHAIIVTYFPDYDFIQRLELISCIFKHIYIIDNSADQKVEAYLTSCASNIEVTITYNDENIGIAAALNKGVTQAKERGACWCVFFDQDTFVYKNFLDIYKNAYKAYGQKIVLIGGNYFNYNKNTNFISYNKINNYTKRKTAITSGFMSPISVISEIGVFREDYFIDSVDHEFCLRARSYDYEIIITTEPTMKHELGMSSSNNLLNFSLVPNHTAIRKYYMTRNTITTVRDYFTREPLWSCKQITRLFIETLSIIMFEQNKYSKTKATLLGVKHAFQRKLGPCKVNF